VLGLISNVEVRNNAFTIRAEFQMRLNQPVKVRLGRHLSVNEFDLPGPNGRRPLQQVLAVGMRGIAAEGRTAARMRQDSPSIRTWPPAKEPNNPISTTPKALFKYSFSALN
jgi:hypothetical protein